MGASAGFQITLMFCRIPMKALCCAVIMLYPSKVLGVLHVAPKQLHPLTFP
jgi:hypothetical protein